jgi:hypothetical protein
MTGPYSRRQRAELWRPGLELVAISFIVLFQELAFIRWIPSQVRVVAYFPNLVLISAFLGLGLGSLRGRSRSLLWLWPVSLVAVVGSVVVMGGVVFTAKNVSEFLWLLYYDLPAEAPVVEGIRIPLVTVFALSAVSFVPLGQAIGQRLDVFRRGSSSLWGYSLDLAGSLLGVVGFTIASYLGTFPVVWFAVFLVPGAFLLSASRSGRLIWLAGSGAVITSVFLFERAHDYSPYYGIAAHGWGGDHVVSVTTNGSLHQEARDIRLDGPRLHADDEVIRKGYHLPYSVLGRPPVNALVMGAGTGNDVAALLQHGAERVDAVEIDPVIAELGRRRHPNRPYASNRVALYVTDARTFMRRAEERYDLVVFGTLDSMTRTSALSSVRLDNFVYTLDSITRARELVAPGGGLIMYFRAAEPYIEQRLIRMLEVTFGRPPLVVTGEFKGFNTILMAGEAFTSDEKLADLGLEAPPPPAARAAVELPTDDWPYLYLESRQVGSFYRSLMALFMAFAVVGVLFASTELRAGLKRRRLEVDHEMFLFGFGFLLLETHFVTAMGLVWGGTWLTNVVVFSAILATILLGTVLMELRPLSRPLAAAGLIASLLIGYVIEPQALLFPSDALKLSASVLYVGTPVFFASACFALAFATRPASDVAFGWNVLGAVAGGLLEFLSMSYGIRAMLLLAALAYLITFLQRSRATANQADSPLLADGHPLVSATAGGDRAGDP